MRMSNTFLYGYLKKKKHVKNLFTKKKKQSYKDILTSGGENI